MSVSFDSKKIAFFGGTFDPVHNGHLTIARTLVKLFELDEFVFVPAFHAPHKPDRSPTSGYHRFTMLALATENDPKIKVSPLELKKREKRYTVDTLAELKSELPNDRIFFVMGADSWMDIKAWREWEQVLTAADHIVVSRPGYEIGLQHVTDEIRERVIDLREIDAESVSSKMTDGRSIFITDAVIFDTSATELRTDLSDGVLDRVGDVPHEVAKYIEKYELYR